MASAMEKVIEIAANNLFDNSSVQTCLTAVTDLSNNLDTRVTALIDGAPGALNTLNELASALGDDANYATTVTNSLALKYQAGNDVSFNDASLNIVDIMSLKVNGVSITQNGGASTDASFNNLTIAGQYGTGGSGTLGDVKISFIYPSGVVNDPAAGSLYVGSYNVDDNTSGSRNTAIGYDSLSSNKAGSFNVSIGTNSLKKNTSGNRNTAVGANCMDSNTNGYENTALGMGCLTNNTSGEKNTCSGYASLYSTNSGDENSAHGYKSLYNNQQGSFNAAMGPQSMENNTTGHYNTALGYKSGPTSGNLSNTICIGANASVTDSSMCRIGDDDIKVGIGTSTPTCPLHVVGSGLSLIVSGDLSGNDASFNVVDITSLKVNGVSITQNGGDINISYHNNSLYIGSVGTGEGEKNTATGHLSLDNTSGHFNTANGYMSLYSNTLGMYNTAYGTESLKNNTLGKENIAIGYRSLYANTEGNYNTASGHNSLCNNTVGYNNIALGRETLKNNINGYNNISIGSESLTGTTSGNNNIALGYQAGKNNTNLSNTICIGLNSSVTANNMCRIGDANTLVGIGTSSPTEALDVSGNIKANNASFNVVDIHTLNLTTALLASGVGLGNVDNTTDAGKPVSTAQQTALDLKATLAGPTFTGKVTMGDVSANDGSFNVVDIASLKVNGVSITQNGSGGASLNVNSDISINAIDAVDASFNILRTSGTMALGGHILPTTNAVYDLGSAEYKIRHLFLSDNSLWVGDNHKIDISGGKMRFKKRKNDKVPSAVTAAGGNEENALTHAFGGSHSKSLTDMTLDKWQNYAATLSGAPGIKEMFGNDKPGEFDTDRDLLNAVQLPTKSDAGAPATTPTAGTMVFNTTDNKLYIYNGSYWRAVDTV